MKKELKDDIQIENQTINNSGILIAIVVFALPIMLVLGMMFDFWQWWLSRLATGFAMAIVAWGIKKARKKPAENFFIIWWGFGLTAIFALYDIMKLLFAGWGWGL